MTLKINRLFVDNWSEFKGFFARFCTEQGIHLHVFKKTEGSKRRLAIVERFNRTIRRLLEKQKLLSGKRQIKDLLQPALRRYNRYDNNRALEDFFRRDLVKDERWGGARRRFFPALMLKEGVEDQYIASKAQKTQTVDMAYREEVKKLKPGVKVRYVLRKEDRVFGKAGKGTLSAPVTLMGRHYYNRTTDKATRRGFRMERTPGPSFEVQGTTQRFLPYELRVV